MHVHGSKKRYLIMIKIYTTQHHSLFYGCSQRQPKNAVLFFRTVRSLTCQNAQIYLDQLTFTFAFNFALNESRSRKKEKKNAIIFQLTYPSNGSVLICTGQYHYAFCRYLCYASSRFFIGEKNFSTNAFFNGQLAYGRVGPPSSMK